MTTPNEELIAELQQLANEIEISYRIEVIEEAVEALQSQAERIAELERESETHAKAYGLAIVERDNLRHELKVAQEGWRCECSTDDACRFARERDAKAERIKELESECEVERLRLAACGVAALGYFDGCKDEYKSASLDDVLRLNKRCADLRAELGDLPEAQAEMLAEIKRLRAQLAAIAATAPVAKLKPCKEGWFIDLDNPPPLTGETIELFTRPMPAQDVTELVEALEEYGRAGVGNSTDWRVQLSALRLATAALSKYKGAK